MPSLKHTFKTLTLFALLSACTTDFVRSEIAAGIRGEVFLSEGETQTPIAGALCTLEGSGQSTTTDAQGAFVFGDLFEGNYFVLCRYSIDMVPYSVLQASPLKEGEALDVGALELQLSGAIEGTVNLVGGTEHAGVLVTVPGTSINASSDTQGDFLIDDMPAGDIGLRFAREGYLPIELSSASVPAGETLRLEVVLLAINNGASGSLVLGDGASVSTSKEVQVSLVNSSDARQMFLSDNPAFAGAEAQEPVETLTWTFDDEGEATLYLKYEDQNGVSGTVVSDTIFIDTQAPQGTLTIAQGAAAVAQRDVTLDIFATDATAVAHMNLSNDTTLDLAAWQPFDPTPLWTLSAGDGTKNVYLHLRDAQGLISTTLYDAIELDTQAPPALTVNLPGGGILPTAEVEVDLGGPQTAFLILSEGSGPPPTFAPTPLGQRLPFQRNFSWELSPSAENIRDLGITPVDLAGNLGPTTVFQIEVDSSLPTPPIVVDEGTTVRSNSSSHTLTLAAPSTDANLVGYEIYGGGNTNFTDWVVSPEPLVVQMFAEACFSLGLRALDAAGNRSAPAWKTVCLDQSPPDPVLGIELLSLSLGSPSQNIMRAQVAGEASMNCALSYQYDAEAIVTVDLAPQATFVVPEQATINYTLECSDTAGNVALESFSENSGTGVSALQKPPSPWTAANSPYWVMGTVGVEGPLALGAGTDIRAAAGQTAATLMDITSLSADGSSEVVAVTSIKLVATQISLNDIEFEDAEVEAMDALDVQDCIFSSSVLRADFLSSNGQVLRTVFRNSDFESTLLGSVSLVATNNLLSEQASFLIGWPSTATLSLLNNSFLDVGQTQLFLSGPIDVSLGAENLSLAGNFWNTQSPSLIDPMLQLTVGGALYQGLAVIDTSPGMLPSAPHPDTPPLP